MKLTADSKKSRKNTIKASGTGLAGTGTERRNKQKKLFT